MNVSNSVKNFKNFQLREETKSWARIRRFHATWCFDDTIRCLFQCMKSLKSSKHIREHTDRRHNNIRKMCKQPKIPSSLSLADVSRHVDCACRLEAVKWERMTSTLEGCKLTVVVASEDVEIFFLNFLSDTEWTSSTTVLQSKVFIAARIEVKN